MYWMSLSSSMFGTALLHLIEHRAEGCLQRQCLLDLVGAHERVFAVLHETRALVLAGELDEGRRVSLPVLRKALEVFEYGIDAERLEQAHGILGVFIEVRVEDALVHEVRHSANIEQHPTQVMQLQDRETVRVTLNGFREFYSVVSNHLLPPRDNLRDDREAVAGRGFREDRPVAAALRLPYVATLRYRHRGGLRPIFFALRVGHARLLLESRFSSSRVKLALR